MVLAAPMSQNFMLGMVVIMFLMASQFLYSNFKVRDFSFVYLTDHRGPGDAEIGEERGVDAEPGIWQDGPSMSRMR